MMLLLLVLLQDKDVLQDEGPSVEDRELLNLLKTQKITLDMPSVPLHEFKDQLQTYTGRNFAIVGIEDQTMPVAAQLTDVTVEQLLNISLGNVTPRLDWIVEDGVVIISPLVLLRERTTLRSYPIGALPMKGEALVDLVKRSVEHDQWKVEGRSIRLSGDRLLVRTNAGTHEAIQEFLDALAGPVRHQLDVEVYFLAVKESALREMRWGANRIKEETFATLLKQAEEGKEATLVGAGDVVCFDGQTAATFGGTERAPEEQGKPVVRDGTQIEVRPSLTQDGTIVLIELAAAHAVRLPDADGMKVYRVGTTVRAARDQYVIAGSVGEYGAENHRVIVVVRARVVE